MLRIAVQRRAGLCLVTGLQALVNLLRLRPLLIGSDVITLSIL